MSKAKHAKQAGQGMPRRQADRRQFDQARRAHAKGLIATEDYIWAAMQCYAAEMRAGRRA